MNMLYMSYKQAVQAYEYTYNLSRVHMGFHQPRWTQGPRGSLAEDLERSGMSYSWIQPEVQPVCVIKSHSEMK